MADPAFRPTVFLRVGTPPGKTAPGRHTTPPTAATKLTLPAPVYVDSTHAAEQLPALVFLRQAHGAATFRLVTGGGFPGVWAGRRDHHSTRIDDPGVGVGVLRTLSTVRPKLFLRPTQVALSGGGPSLSASSTSSSRSSSRSLSPSDGTDTAAFALDRPRGSSSARLRFCAPQLGGDFAWTAEPAGTLTLWHQHVAGARRRMVVARFQRSSGQLAIDGEAALRLLGRSEGHAQQQREQLVAAVVTTALCVVGGI